MSLVQKRVISSQEKCPLSSNQKRDISSQEKCSLSYSDFILSNASASLASGTVSESLM